MNVVINSDCLVIPEHAKALVTEHKAELNFLLCLGYDEKNPPLADLLKRSKGLEGNWLIFSPIHWQASHNDAMIAAADAELNLSDTESKSLFDLYAEYLNEDAIHLYYYNETIWLLCCDNKPNITAKPVHQLINHSLMPELKQLDTSMYWQKFFTECQMFFAVHYEQSVVNGGWLWGGAPLNENTSTTVFADAHFFPLAQQCTSNAVLYNPSLSLKNCSILLIEHIDVLSKEHQKELQKSAHWYWNNSAYTCSDLNWFTRFWRKLSHAH